MKQETAQFLRNTADVIRATLPLLAQKPDNEKTSDDFGMEFLGPAYLFLYEGHQPNADQFQQLKDVASTVAQTYKNLREVEEEGTGDQQELGLLQYCRAFLYLWQKKIDFSNEVTRH